MNGFLYNNFIADFFKIALDFIYNIVGSYGWSIVLLTVLFRLLMLPLDIKQKKNTRKQQALQPKVNEINKKYANDKEMQSKKTMELYKQEGFNPLSGCLPLLLQMPVFFAFFGALSNLASAQIQENIYLMAEAGKPVVTESWLWVKNIWQPDNYMSTIIPEFKAVTRYEFFKVLGEESYNAVMLPIIEQHKNTQNGFFILPALAGTMSFLQSKMAMPAQPEPAKKDPNQPTNPMSGKTMQYIMPVFSVFICLTSSAAFALYWSMSNLISVANFFVMNRIFAKQEQQKIEFELEQPKTRKMERKLPKL